MLTLLIPEGNREKRPFPVWIVSLEWPIYSSLCLRNPLCVEMCSRGALLFFHSSKCSSREEHFAILSGSSFWYSTNAVSTFGPKIALFATFPPERDDLPSSRRNLRSERFPSLLYIITRRTFSFSDSIYRQFCIIPQKCWYLLTFYFYICVPLSFFRNKMTLSFFSILMTRRK